MRKLICCTMLGAILSAAVSYLATEYMGCRWRQARFREEAERKAEENVCSAEEPHPLDALLPDPAKLLADWQAFETIDLLRPQADSNLAKREEPVMQLPSGLVSAEMIRAADEAECFRLMPYSDSTTASARTLPYNSEGSEESEQPEVEQTEPLDPKTVEERLQRILQSYLRDGKLNGRANIDTMEFRPSDAKKGEFDRIPF